MTQSWRLMGSELVHDAGIFRLNLDRYEHLGQPTHPYYVLEAGDWVNIVALTPDERVVLVRQYRHGVRESSLEIPGGMVDPEDENPAGAAARELWEETGYRGDPLQPLVVVSSNPAILCNRTHSFLSTGSVAVSEPSPEEHEDIEVVLLPIADVRSRIASGEIHHSLSVAALVTYLLGRHA